MNACIHPYTWILYSKRWVEVLYISTLGILSIEFLLRLVALSEVGRGVGWNCRVLFLCPGGAFNSPGWVPECPG